MFGGSSRERARSTTLYMPADDDDDDDAAACKFCIFSCSAQDGGLLTPRRRQGGKSSCRALVANHATLLLLGCFGRPSLFKHCILTIYILQSLYIDI